MKFSFALLFVVLVCWTSTAQVVDGSSIFSTNCAACHTIGKGKLVGPDLKGIADRYERQWIARFIRESQAMVAEGDEKAVAVFNANFMIPMPNVPLSDEEIEAVMNHISNIDSGPPEVPIPPKPKVSTNSTEVSKFNSGLSEDQREATFRSMMTGFWIALGAFAAMGIGIWYSTRA